MFIKKQFNVQCSPMFNIVHKEKQLVCEHKITVNVFSLMTVCSVYTRKNRYKLTMNMMMIGAIELAAPS